MTLRPREDISKLKKVASKKLGLKAKRIFLASGTEISNIDELQNNDTLYVSQGEPFYKSSGTWIILYQFESIHSLHLHRQFKWSRYVSSLRFR